MEDAISPQHVPTSMFRCDWRIHQVHRSAARSPARSSARSWAMAVPPGDETRSFTSAGCCPDLRISLPAYHGLAASCCAISRVSPA